MSIQKGRTLALVMGVLTQSGCARLTPAIPTAVPSPQPPATIAVTRATPDGGGDPRLTQVPEAYRGLYQGSMDELEAGRAALPFDAIAMERQPCFGACPVYTVTLERSGRASLVSQSWKPGRGRYFGLVDIATYTRLNYAIEHLGFADLEPRPWAISPDAATVVVTATMRTGSKRVEDNNGSGPIELWTIQQLIDKAMQDIAWIPLDNVHPVRGGDPCLWDHATAYERRYFAPAAEHLPLRTEDVTSTVKGPRLAIAGLGDTGAYDFGLTPMDTPIRRTFVVSNVGDQPLHVWFVDPEFPGFMASIGGRTYDNRSMLLPEPLLLSPGEDTVLEVGFDHSKAPTQYRCRTVTGRIEIVSDDPTYGPYLDAGSGMYETRVQFFVEPRPQTAAQIATLQALPTPTPTPNRWP